MGHCRDPTKHSRNNSDVSSHSPLIPHGVLHVPDMICNFIGQPFIFTDGHDSVLQFGNNSRESKSSGTVKYRQGKNFAYLGPRSLFHAIKVRRSPNGLMFGPHVIKKDVTYVLGC
jgi:hypothetical protein